MRLRNYREHKKPQLMIIPMIDIIFFLLVFFMISMLSMVEQKGLTVNLPQAASQEQMNKNIVLTVTKDGQLYFNKEPMSLDLLGQRLVTEQRKDSSQLTVVVNADKNAKHGWVVNVLDVVKNAGVTKLAIATEKQ